MQLRNNIGHISTLKLTFYTLEPIPELFKPLGFANQPRAYYWEDPNNPQGHGPFKSLMQAMEHYNFMTKPVVVSDLQPTALVIPVDFRNKKKITKTLL